jgi:ABC-2 type transport system ATP-binding protein
LIVAQDLVKKYPNVTALEGLTFTVDAGEIFGFLGPNGAGKTTTIRILTGQIRPTSGRASVYGLDVVNDRRSLRREIGVVFDTPTLYDELSARRNLTLFTDLYDLPRTRADELLDRVGLLNVADRPVRKMSRGMRQRVMIARALVPSPRVLFLDEPTGGLDASSAAELKGLIRSIVTIGTTVFLTTHQMEVADELCDRVAIVDRGRVVTVDSPAQLKRQHATPVVRIDLADGSVRLLGLSDEQLGEELRVTAAEGIARISTVEPTLEQVLLRLTGRGRS